MDSAPYSTDRAVYHDGKEDILEPLKRYREEFRDEFARRAAKTFEDLVTQTGTDAAANRELCALIQAQDAERDTKIFKRRWLIALLVLLWLGLAACIGIVCMDIQQLRIAGADNTTVQSLIISVISGLTAIMLLITLHRRSAAMKQAINELSAAIEANIRLAYQQLEALNASYSWHIIHDLICATVPRIALDPYFSESRLEDLVHHFGYSHSLYSDRSVLASQSGDLNGNPFVFADLLGMRWQDHTYTGYKHITWKRRERSYDGKWRTVTHHQTLSASVTAPVPEYYQHPVVIYGNEAAPALAFSRVPSEHSGAEDT
ncbi:MAG: hypothetical protein J6S21_08115, partial [Victivallales bacterium]|nr:hypothetical protein [Victivallales bacterium]